MTAARRDAVIVGGGLAGGMIALELARAGRDAVLFEQSMGPHDKVCGEFLSSESLLYLQRCGLDLNGLGAVPITSVRLVTGDRTEEAALPFSACSLTRRRLDEELLHRATLAGADVRRGATVDALRQTDGAWRARLRDGDAVAASHAFLATGKHDLRGWARPAGLHNGLVGFKMYYRLSAQQHAALGHAVELTLFPGGYAGMQPVEDGTANLCLLIEARRLHTVGSNWAGVLDHLTRSSGHLAERLQAATPLRTAPLAASHIPYGHMQRTTEAGLWRVGDQAAVIPSFCGDGMAIALHSGALAATHFLGGGNAPTYQRKLRRQLGARLRLATLMSRILVGLPRAAQVVRLYPGLLAAIASATRIPHHVLLTDDRHGAYTLDGTGAVKR